ncbi:MAG: hypothetical protein ACLP8A_07705, partial [Methylovirgula sp.]
RDRRESLKGLKRQILSTRSFELIKHAMEKKQQVNCQYRGYTRNFCPYVLGFDDHGKERVLALLVRNTPTGPMVGGWECLELESVWNVKSTEEAWVAAPAGARPDCVKHVDIDVEAAAA